MNSCIYISKIAHQRFFPKKNSFLHSIYMMYIDLDELGELDKKYKIFSYNKWNVFSFSDKDHFKFLDAKGNVSSTISKENVKYDSKRYLNKATKERIKILAGELNFNFEIDKVFILTNLRNFGYIFNPVSFYYCFDKEGRFRVMFSEVNNTFHDQKMYFTLIKDDQQKIFKSKQKKNYYISPFISYDNDLEWEFSLPGEKMTMQICSMKKGKIELKTFLSGYRKEISSLNLFLLQVRYPMITLGIIIVIHYQALKLWIKKVKFYKKSETDKKIFQDINK